VAPYLRKKAAFEDPGAGPAGPRDRGAGRCPVNTAGDFGALEGPDTNADLLYRGALLQHPRLRIPAPAPLDAAGSMEVRGDGGGRPRLAAPRAADRYAGQCDDQMRALGTGQISIWRGTFGLMVVTTVSGIQTSNRHHLLYRASRREHVFLIHLSHRQVYARQFLP